MRNKETSENAKIKQAYVNAVPDICDVILSDCEKGKGGHDGGNKEKEEYCEIYDGGRRYAGRAGGGDFAAQQLSGQL